MREYLNLIMRTITLFVLFAFFIVSNARLPTFTRGVYLLLADNTVSVKNDQGQDVPSIGPWQPKAGSWITQFNVIFFTFIDSDMVVPPAFEYARENIGFAPGTKIIYAIGGYSYSSDQKWKEVFGTPELAKKLASQVANWKCDGIDLDLEDPIGNDLNVALNIVVFAKELKRIRPDFIISQPVFGYPQVFSESLITVESWDHLGTSKTVADSIGLMVYTGTRSLQFVSNYDGSSCTQWWCALCTAAKVQFPCAAVPIENILAGLGGDAQTQDVATVCAHRSGVKPIGGYMVWYASVDNGFQYSGGTQDARISSTKWNQCGNGQMDEN